MDVLQKIKSRLAIDEGGNNIEEGNRYNEDFSYLDFHTDRLKYLFQLAHKYYQAGNKFLDIGSLFGYNCLGAQILGYQAFGLDLPKYTEQFRDRFRRYKIDNRSCDLGAQPMPFSDNEFDLIMASEVVEHFSFHPLCFFQESFRVLKPGGRLIITTPNLIRLNNVFKMLLGKSINWDIGDEYWDGVHRREFTGQELVFLAESSGLKIEALSYQNFDYPNISWPLKLINTIGGWIFPARRGNIILIANKTI